jgi:hypothetical protein
MQEYLALPAVALLHSAAGVLYDEFSTLREPVPVTAATGSGFVPSPGAAATGWIDRLQPTGARRFWATGIRASPAGPH